MNKLLTWVSVLLVVVFGGRALVQHMSRSANENAATTRVERFLRGMTQGGDFQDAFNMWEAGDVGAIQRMGQEEYNGEVARLNAWLGQRGLGQRIERYEVLGATMVAPPEGSEAVAVEVSCTINGRPATILAVKDQRLEWVE
jgi:hypothetical protein